MSIKIECPTDDQRIGHAYDLSVELTHWERFGGEEEA